MHALAPSKWACAPFAATCADLLGQEQGSTWAAQESQVSTMSNNTAADCAQDNVAEAVIERHESLYFEMAVAQNKLVDRSRQSLP